MGTSIQYWIRIDNQSSLKKYEEQIGAEILSEAVLWTTLLTFFTTLARSVKRLESKTLAFKTTPVLERVKSVPSRNAKKAATAFFDYHVDRRR